MAITTAFCNKAKQDYMDGNITGSHTFKFALYTNAATLDATTLTYSATNETVGAGYTAGGITLTGYSSSLVSGIANATFNNVFIPTASFTARGGLVYDASFNNRAIAVYDFGADYTATSGSWQYIFPAPGATAALRIS